MIKLKLSFGKAETETNSEIDNGEKLRTAVERATKDVPLGEFTADRVFNVVVNGHIIGGEFWDNVRLVSTDNILITPKISDGDNFGQILTQVVVIAAAIVATILTKGMAAGWSAAIVAAVTIGTTLAMNALIPPPMPELGPEGGGLAGSVEDSQMYSITGQSNQMKRLGTVPKVYGSHRVFPTLAATPYVELSVDPDNGETIQYLCGIYDFGLGTPQLSDIKIGDTPLTEGSFIDFQTRLVDPNRPYPPVDDFDVPLNGVFQLYKGDRSTAALSFALEDGTEIIQNTDNNPDSLQQEIILDFICPRGLFGFSSGGASGPRRINLDIDFALVGTSDWKPYNDPAEVDSHDSVGGTEKTSFQELLVAIPPTHPLFNTYYQGLNYNTGNYQGEYNTDTIVSVFPGNRLLVPFLATVDPGDREWEVGQSVYTEDTFIGIIQAVNAVPGYPAFSEVVLDRVIPVYVPAYNLRGFAAYVNGVPQPITYDPVAIQRKYVKSFFNEYSRAAVLGAKSTPIYANVRFKPKTHGQYQVRVRRIGTEGDFVLQKGDDITWVGLTTAYARPPINTTKRHVFMELKIRATNQLNGNIQNLSAVATQVLDIYDEDTETWFRGVTNNPAWVLADLLSGEVNKKPVPKSRLHLPSILAWAAYCDEVPAPPPSQTFVMPRFSCNFVLDYESTLQQVLFQVGGSAQASLNIVDGKYGVLVDRLKTTPVQIFTPRNSKNFSSNRLYSTRPHGVKVKFIDPQLGWEVSEVIVYDNGYNELNAIDFDELTSFACTSQEQAWRFGRYMIAQNRLRQETIYLSVDFENLICTRGDYVQISQDVMQVGGRPARVKAVNGTEIIIDDHLDIDPDLSYGYTYRSATGEILDSTLTPISGNTFSINARKIVFVGQNTTAQTLDSYYRTGGVPPIIGSTRKVTALAGVFALGNTTYTLPESPLSTLEIVCWLNGILTTSYTLTGNVVTFSGQDTTGFVFDTQYRYTGSASNGSMRKVEALAGVFSAGDTDYTLPEAPISDHDTTVWLDGIMRTDYVLTVDNVKFVGQDTTGQVLDVQYRYPGGSSPIGSGKKSSGLVGVFSGGDTTYTLPDGPLSDNDLIVCLNGVMRTDYDLNGDIPAVGDLIVIGEIGKIVFDCIVKSISPNDDMSAQISLVERANAIFDYESSDVLPDYDPQLSNTARPDFSPPKAVVGLTLTTLAYECAQTQSGYNYYAEVTWDIPPGSVYEYFEIWTNDGRGYRLATQTNAKYFKTDIDQTRLGSLHGIKVVAVASSGRKLQLIQMPEVTFTPTVKSDPPSDVDTLGMSITNQTLQLSWTPIPDCDVNKYEIRYSPDTNDIWETAIQLQIVDRNVNSLVVQARTGVYLIKAVDFAGNKSANPTRTITTIPDLFDLNVIETLNDAPGFAGELNQTEKLGDAVVLQELVAGTVDTMQFQPEGYYVVFDLLDLGDIYSVRLASYIRADGYRFGELISSWEHLSEVDHLSTSESEDWNVVAEYRATNEILAMSDWVTLTSIDHINQGLGQGFTDWRPIPTIGDATGRVFQFRVKLESLTPNVTPRLFDATIKADMPDRVDTFENLVSSASDPLLVSYEKSFRGPGTSPNVQITLEDGQAGDYWVFTNKNLEGFQIEFYDNTDTQVVRTFDVAAKGFGSRHTVTI